MSTYSPAAGAARLTDTSLAEAAGARAVVLTRASRRRGPGAHREPGATPWRTGLREIVMALSFGFLEPWPSATRPARLRTAFGL